MGAQSLNLDAYNFDGPQGASALRRFIKIVELADPTDPLLKNKNIDHSLFQEFIDAVTVGQDKDHNDGLMKEILGEKTLDELNEWHLMKYWLRCVDLDWSRISVRKLLNRFLGLEKSKQNFMFEIFLTLYEEKIREDKCSGVLDVGILPLAGKIAATSFDECDSFLINEDAEGNKAYLYNVQMDYGITWTEAMAIKRNNQHFPSGCTFIRHKNDKLSVGLCVFLGRAQSVRFVRPSGCIAYFSKSYLKNYEVISEHNNDLKKAWNEMYERRSKPSKQIISGAILSLWPIVNPGEDTTPSVKVSNNAQIVRGTFKQSPEDEARGMAPKTFIGLEPIHAGLLPKMLRNIRSDWEARKEAIEALKEKGEYVEGPPPVPIDPKEEEDVYSDDNEFATRFVPKKQKYNKGGAKRNRYLTPSSLFDEVMSDEDGSDDSLDGFIVKDDTEYDSDGSSSDNDDSDESDFAPRSSNRNKGAIATSSNSSKKQKKKKLTPSKKMKSSSSSTSCTNVVTIPCSDMKLRPRLKRPTYYDDFLSTDDEISDNNDNNNDCNNQSDNNVDDTFIDNRDATKSTPSANIVISSSSIKLKPRPKKTYRDVISIEVDDTDDYNDNHDDNDDSNYFDNGHPHNGVMKNGGGLTQVKAPASSSLTLKIPLTNSGKKQRSSVSHTNKQFLSLYYEGDNDDNDFII